MIKALCIANCANRRAVLESFFKDECEFVSAVGLTEAERILETSEFDAVFADAKASFFLIDKEEFISSFKKNHTMLFVATETESERKKVKTLNNKSVVLLPPIQSLSEIKDFVNKFFNPKLLRCRQTNSVLKNFIGVSPAIQEVKEKIIQYSKSDSPVLLFGETGSGKEIIANTIHNLSERCKNPFHAVNMAAIPEGVAESELFGTEKGAFTDATSRKGHILASNRGTLFLDEISSCSLLIQAKLLRVLEEKRVTALGQEKSVPFDSRIISATNENLLAMRKAKTFRDDLFYRLCVLTIDIPPLRERKEDILPLLNFFATKAGCPEVKFSSAALDKLLAHTWQGNVRELKNCFERAISISTKKVISASDIIFL